MHSCDTPCRDEKRRDASVCASPKINFLLMVWKNWWWSLIYEAWHPSSSHSPAFNRRNFSQMPPYFHHFVCKKNICWMSFLNTTWFGMPALYSTHHISASWQHFVPKHAEVWVRALSKMMTWIFTVLLSFGARIFHGLAYELRKYGLFQR